MGSIQKVVSFVWSGLGNFVQIGIWLGAFALTAWAAKAAELLSAYAPFSWVGAGICGGLVVSVSYWLFASSRAKWVRTKYDNTMMLRGGMVDPLAKTFEAKRIYLSEFVLPSHPVIEGKTFIDCEIIGPSNVLLVSGNSVAEGRSPHCDAIALRDGDLPINGIFLRNCTFRGCSFLRVTFLISEQEIETNRDVNWLHWIGHTPEPVQNALNLNEPQGPPQQQPGADARE
ncbi:hypothetical protein [Brevundimonas sp.]|uniref:hypothetical protein n=1 Tax=Brevundimonas sp. TaxID=1871086 RepID=UPI003F71BFC8